MFLLDSDFLPVTDSSHVSTARRAVIDFARRADILDAQAEKAALIATELGTNLVKHATGENCFFRLSAMRPIFARFI